MRNPVHDVSRSLNALPERFSRLLYLASLRDQGGDYQHWGLNREYGEERTRAAFCQVHRSCYDSVIQDELAEIMKALREYCAKSGRTCEAVVAQLLHEAGIRPPGLQEHASLHFNYVLASLLALSQSG